VTAKVVSPSDAMTAAAAIVIRRVERASGLDEPEGMGVRIEFLKIMSRFVRCASVMHK
jgi:hypothetical protein